VSIVIDREAAKRVLFEEAAAEARGATVPESWQQAIEGFSQACDDSSKTHIAFLGTALLAKATSLQADAFAVKARAPTAGAYSARGLGHGVLVPNALLLGIHLGVTGREPLNNQPYFRILRATLAEVQPLVRGHALVPVKLLVRILEDLEKLTTLQQARDALRAFIRVRRAHQAEYPTAPQAPLLLTPPQLSLLIEQLVSADSEGGKRAQAVAAGLLDAAVGVPRRVQASKINDPDKHFAGDVGVLREADGKEWERVFEVRDKKVSPEDVLLFAGKLATDGVRRGAVLAVALRQPTFHPATAESWAADHGVNLVVFFGWRSFVEQVLFWYSSNAFETCTVAHRRIRERLQEMECSAAALVTWDARLLLP